MKLTEEKSDICPRPSGSREQGKRREERAAGSWVPPQLRLGAAGWGGSGSMAA